ncbi:MAG TPA: class I SAM-dependent methyltransferase [Gemmatimonadaceae bacterium]|nr:class I SAM-dependent methyltransferase [Gemmatimonadaceae bacterium]
MPSSFPDHFSATAAGYAAFRPHYPPALFAWLAAQAPARRRAWDCATGSGQAAVALAAHFDFVVASDASQAQLARAESHAKVSYVAMTAERTALATASTDVITVAQALHWFDRDAFFAEAERVLAPGGVVAAWSYGPMALDGEQGAITYRFYAETVGPYWPPERSLVDTGYGRIEFPFDEVRPPDVRMEYEWTLAEVLGYMGTWSAVQVYRRERGTDPIPDLAAELAASWGDPQTRRTVRWPVSMRVGRARKKTSTG